MHENDQALAGEVVAPDLTRAMMALLSRSTTTMADPSDPRNARPGDCRKAMSISPRRRAATAAAPRQWRAQPFAGIAPAARGRRLCGGAGREIQDAANHGHEPGDDEKPEKHDHEHERRWTFGFGRFASAASVGRVVAW